MLEADSYATDAPSAVELVKSIVAAKSTVAPDAQSHLIAAAD